MKNPLRTPPTVSRLAPLGPVRVISIVKEGKITKRGFAILRDDEQEATYLALVQFEDAHAADAPIDRISVCLFVKDLACLSELLASAKLAMAAA